MDPPSMRVEWRYITMVCGVQCMMISGIWKMHKLCVDNWALVEKLPLGVMHTMDRVLVGFGLIMWAVMAMNRPLKAVHIEYGEVMTVNIEKMLV